MTLIAHNYFIRSNYKKTGGHFDYGFIGIAHGKTTCVLNANGIYYTAITTSAAGGVGEIVSIGAIMVAILQGETTSGSIGITAGGGGITNMTLGLRYIHLNPFVSGASGGGGVDYPTVWGVQAQMLSADGDDTAGSFLASCDGQSIVLQYCLFIVSR